MSKERDNKLIVFETSLVKLDLNPALQIDVAQRINFEVCEAFEIERFLDELNDRIFEGKGEIKPLSQSTSITPHSTEQNQDGSSRFKRLFSMKYGANGVQGGTELYVKTKEIVEKLQGRKPEAIGIRVHQAVDIQDKKFSFTVLGKLYFGPNHKRSSTGNWDGSPVFLGMMIQGRIISFSLNSTPSGEIIARTLMQNTLEILKELGAQKIISSIVEEDTA